MNEQNKKSENEVFSGANVPINVVARIMKKDPQFVRICLQKGILPIGVAVKKSDNSRQFDYYVSDKLLYEYCGYMYKPDDYGQDKDESK